MTIGIFGGTFNPIHLGHEAMIDAFLEAIVPDKMLVIPNAQPPHKESSHLATEEDRLAMLELALAERACHIDKRELLRSGKSYTFETLRSLREEYPKDRFVLLVGADSLLSFEKWVRFEEILSQTELAVFERGGISGGEDETLRKEAKRLEQEYGAQIYLIEGKIPPISSTIVRQKAAAGMDLSDLVSPSVGEYLKKKNLYLDPAEIARQKSVYGISLPDAENLAKKVLSPKRAYHSLCVAKMAGQLAEKAGADPVLAAIAGCLHDLYREESAESILQKADKCGIVTVDLFSLPEALLHSKAGSRLLQKEHKICQTICDAVDCHTEGAADMPLLSEILFVSDAVSEDRTYADAPFARELAKKDLHAATAYIFDYMTETLGERMTINSKNGAAFYAQNRTK